MMFKRFKRFLADLRGTRTASKLMLFLGIMGISGIAIDGGNAYVTRAMMQASADAAAAAAVQELPDKNYAKVTALAHVYRNHNANSNGFIAEADDVKIGKWDTEAQRFIEGAEPMNAVVVRLTRDRERGNGLPTYMLRLAGLDTWDIAVEAVGTTAPGGAD